MLRMMTLVAPSEAIWRWASRLAPSAIASMAITDATPKIKPEDGQEHAQLVQREVAHRQQDGDVEPVHDATSSVRSRLIAPSHEHSRCRAVRRDGRRRGGAAARLGLGSSCLAF